MAFQTGGSKPDGAAALLGMGLAELRRSPVLASVKPRAPFEKYANDPVGFASQVLGLEPWGRYEGMPPEEASQVDFLEAIRDHDWVAIKSGHKVSKSSSDAILALWWPMTRVGGRVTLTAPASHQVKSILWPEVRLLFKGEHPAQTKKPNLPGHLYEDPGSGLKIADGWGILGLTTDTAERMAGKSGAEQLYIVDEASGYPEDILTAIFGNLAGGGKVLLTGNPTQLSGTFHAAFHGSRAQWKTLSVASTSTPNFHGGNIPGLAGPTWHAWALETWGGPGNPIYDVRVLGRFPSQGENSVVALVLVEAAKGRWATTAEDGDGLDLGVDVARGGDDETIVAPRRGRKLLPLESVKLDRAPEAIPPGHQVGEAVVKIARTLRRATDTRKARIKVDAIGVGTSVLDYLVASYGREFDIVGVNSASSADDWLIVAPATSAGPAKTAKDEYRNLRSQMGFGVAAWLRAGGAIPEDGKLEAELVAPTFFFAGAGKIAIEEKDAVKRRLKRSPDRADALALAVYEPLPPVKILPPAPPKDRSSLPRFSGSGGMRFGSEGGGGLR